MSNRNGYTMFGFHARRLKDLAVVVGIHTRGQLYRLTCGELPNFQTLKKVARHTGCTITAVISPDGEVQFTKKEK